MKRHLIRLVLALGLGIAVVTLVAGPGEARRKKGRSTWHPDERAFNHQEHDKMVKGKGLSTKCEMCHKAKTDGTLIAPFRASRDHDRCAQKCHGGGSYRHHKVTKRETGSVPKLKKIYRSNTGRVCYACHSLKAAIQPSNGLSKVNEKPAGSQDYVAVFSHRKHTATSATSGRVCEQCHGAFGSGSPKRADLLGGHKRCATCHARGLDPLMNACGGCHLDKNSERGKAPVMRKRPPNRYATTGAFDHDRHAQENRVGTQGKECLTCHSNIKGAKDDSTVPLPSMLDCYNSCHNGKKAFDATGTTCTRCHQGGRK